MKEKENWIDIVKFIACMLVLLGHFFQGIIKSEVILENSLLLWFDYSIYFFHVALFFICSGYLYQKLSDVRSLKSWKDNVLKKLLVLGVPYVTFSIATYMLKTLFSEAVNTKVAGELWDVLLLAPLSPYWYLYTLFFLFAVTPTFRSKKQIGIAMGVALLALMLRNEEWMRQLYFVRAIATREIWFLFGMALFFWKGLKRFDAKLLLVSFVFFPVSLLNYQREFTPYVTIIYNLFMGILGCIFIMQISFLLEKKISETVIRIFREYTLPIFLMHTIFAAAVRSLLLKMGINNPVIHIIFGIAASIGLPMAAAWIAKRTKYLYFFINPSFVITNKRKEDAG